MKPKSSYKIRLYLNILFLIFLQQPANILGFYEGSHGITKLTSENFDRIVMKSKNVWIVEFYAPWCSHCQKEVPEMEKLGLKKKQFKVGAVDCTVNSDLQIRFHITSYPTFLMFGKNKKLKPKEYRGGQKSNEIFKAMNEKFFKD